MRIHFIQHVHFETPGYLLEWAIAQQHTTSFTRIYEAPAFPSQEEFDVLVIMGGPMGVYEEEKYAWMKEEKAFIKTTIAAGKKVVGICLGAQLIAAVCGAKVYPNKEKEIGWWPVQKIAPQNIQPQAGVLSPIAEKAAALISGLPATFTTFHWHGDTFDLPPGAALLFSTPVCTNQGFLLNNQVAGLQFHFEATPNLVEQMVTHSGDELVNAPYIQPGTQMQALSAQYEATQEKQLQYFINAFLSL
jgi:GMP synthase-like glutamine amidotransferase